MHNPNDLKPFQKLFEKLTNRHSDQEVWNDFLEIVICCYAMQQMEERYLSVIKKYKKQEIEILAQMYAEIVNLYSRNLGHEKWFDGLGAFYETYINTVAKASRTGQFFTPETICDFKARVVLNPDHANQGLRINDCACGSGRLLLAANAVAHGNLYYAEDIDPMCVRLTTVNFLFHNMNGQIVCHNSLDPSSYNFGYEISHPLLFAPMIPVIRHLEKEDAYVYQIGEQWLQEAEEKRKITEADKQAQTVSTPAPKSPITPKAKKAVKAPTEQLSIF